MIENLLFDSSDEENIPRQHRRRKVYRQRINFEFQYESEFYQRFRMSPHNAEILLLEIGVEIQHPTRKGGALSPKEQLCVTLHWLGSGSQYHTIADMHGVNKSTICRAIRRVVNAINRTLFNRVVKWPEDIGNVIEQFHRIANFPYVCGVIDGSLIPIDAPPHNEAAFVDRWGDHSLNCMFICGPTRHFYYVNANWPGSVHDARVLRRSNLYQMMERRNIFPNAVLLGDSAYPLKTWLMTPLHENPNNIQERHYNRRLKSTRQIMECALGILKEKFPCLNHLRVDPVYAAEIVNCCATLCNISRTDEDGEIYMNAQHDNIVGYEQEIDDEPIQLAARLRQIQIINAMN